MKRAIPKYLGMPDKPLELDGFGSRLPARHIFAQDDVDAVNAALAAGRPLLVRGEPGAGKSQLARAAALGLHRAFVSTVIDARSEARDLLWTFDAVRRLADAQLQGFGGQGPGGRAGEDFKDPRDESNYVTPGPLWWAFSWGTATRQARQAGATAPEVPETCDPERGVVVLIDEIDKADGSVPNGLLGSLGDGRFTAPGGTEVACGEVEPLVIVTTNEERALPDAFLRRCLVHHLKLSKDEAKLKIWLMDRGRAHFPDLHDDVLREAADQLWTDRQAWRHLGLAPPGGAEYLDLLRIVEEQKRGDTQGQLDLLQAVGKYVLKKHPLEDAD